MRYYVIAFSISIVLLAFVTGVPSVLADQSSVLDTSSQQQSVMDTGVRLVNPLGKDTTINSFLLNILSIVTDTIGPVIVILMLVYVGFLFVTAQGNPSKIEEARRMLLWTVVGALILLGAKAIAIGICETVKALSTNGSAASCF